MKRATKRKIASGLLVSRTRVTHLDGAGIVKKVEWFMKLISAVSGVILQCVHDQIDLQCRQRYWHLDDLDRERLVEFINRL